MLAPLSRIKVLFFVLREKSLNDIKVTIFSGHCDSVLAEAVQLLQKACSKLLTDEEFCTTEEVRSSVKTYSTYISAIDYLSVSSSAATFIRWHFEMLQSLITDVQNDQTIDQEKLWTMFHEIRTSPLFQSGKNS